MILQCRFCRCDESDPCRLEAGECVLNVQKMLCSNPKCIMAADAEKAKIRREREQKRCEKVKPVRELWNREFALRRLKADRRRGKTKGRA